MSKFEDRLRTIQRIQMVEAMLQDYTLEENEPVFKHTTQDILDKILQYYPEELSKRINADTDGTKAKAMILMEIQKRAQRLQKDGIVAGFKPRDGTSKQRAINPAEVAEWFKKATNVTSLSGRQLTDIMNALGLEARMRKD